MKGQMVTQEAYLKARNSISDEDKRAYQDLGQKLEEMARDIYTAVDPQSIGREHQIMVGPWSGASTVKMAASSLGIDPESLPQDKIHAILEYAKDLGKEIETDDLRRLLNGDQHYG